MSNRFDRLPDELIMHILSFTNFQTMGRFSRTCKRFNTMINKDEFVWQPMTVRLLGSNLKSLLMQSRCRPLLTMKDRCKVSLNWENCDYKCKIIRNYPKAMPCLQLDKLYLYSSDRNRLHRIKRKYDGTLCTQVNKVRSHTGDICKFVLNGGEVISGGRDGTIVRRTRFDFNLLSCTKCYAKELQTLDAMDDIIITGDKAGVIKMWKSVDNIDMFMQKNSVGVRILSLAVMPSKQNFICGLPGTHDIHPLMLYDLQRCKPVRSFGRTFRKGAGILDIFPECENTFLCCSYDTTVQLWDIRTPNGCVRKWEEPFDNSIYSVKSDYNYTIVTGASRNSIVQIWDKRMSRNKHTLSLRHFNSPTYSVTFDGCYIYAGFDKGMLEISLVGDLFGCNECMLCIKKVQNKYLHVL